MSKLTNLEFFTIVAANGEVPAESSRFILPSAIAKTLGFKLIDVGVGTATMEIVADTEKHANPMGTIHGGVLCDIADARRLGPPMPLAWERMKASPVLTYRSISFARSGMAASVPWRNRFIWADRSVVMSATFYETMTSWWRR